ncbi:MAG: hypothetical protein WA982_16050 [Rubrobacteraceae bacterium]
MMATSTRNLLLAAGALWGFALALVPAMVAFAGPLNLSPFLIFALLCATPSGATGTWVAGRRATRSRSLRRKCGWPKWLLSGFMIGILQALVVGVLAALTIWLAMTITMTGFSVATPGAIYLLVSQPSIFLQSAIVARTVFVYALLVGFALAPFTGLAINRVAGREVAAQ